MSVSYIKQHFQRERERAGVKDATSIPSEVSRLTGDIHLMNSVLRVILAALTLLTEPHGRHAACNTCSIYRQLPTFSICRLSLIWSIILEQKPLKQTGRHDMSVKILLTVA